MLHGLNLAVLNRGFRLLMRVLGYRTLMRLRRLRIRRNRLGLERIGRLVRLAMRIRRRVGLTFVLVRGVILFGLALVCRRPMREVVGFV